MNLTKVLVFAIMIISINAKSTYSKAQLIRKIKNALRRGQNSRRTLAGLFH